MLTEEIKIKKALGPAKWKEFKEACEVACKNIGAVSPVQLRIEEESPYAFTVTNVRTGKMATFGYDPEATCIRFDTPEKDGRIDFHLSADGKILQFVERGIPKFIPQLIREIFQGIVR